jgi:hypothetical protein
MRAYARQTNRQLETDAAEIRIRAERRLGEMEAASPKNAGSNRPGPENYHRRFRRRPLAGRPVRQHWEIV